MNKRLSLLCCMTVLFMLLFSVGAFALAEEGECVHSAWCYNPTVCKDCGAKGLEIPDENITHIGEPMWNADQFTHWKECNACNKAISEPENHQGNCNSREYCPVCNTAGVTLSAENLTHVGEVVYDHDNYFHWDACSTCGEKLGEGAVHQGICDAIETCTVCGAEGIIIPTDDHLTHVGDTHYGCDGTYHFDMCDTCGKVIDGTEENHQGVCTDKTTCTICDREGIYITSDNLTHSDEVVYDHDGNRHWEACGSCGARIGMTEEHQGICSADETCTVCGAEGITVSDLTHVGEVSYGHDDYSHWEVCGSCGVSFGNDATHQGICDAKETCTVCGAEGITIFAGNLTHVGGVSYGHDDTTHWEVCGCCGAWFGNDAQHQGTCDAPTACTVCGAEGITIYTENLTHTGGVVYDHDGTYHWETCGSCGAQIGMTVDHEGTCDAPTTCTVCGAEGIDIFPENLTHVGGIVNDYDADSHWEACGGCGEKRGEEAAHQGICDAKETCIICGAEGITVDAGNLTHVGGVSYGHNDTSHWEVCGTCGEKLGEEAAHQGNCDAPGTCTVCGLTNIEIAPENLTHVGEVVYGISDLVHWDSCGTCGEKIGDYVYHQADCTAKETCTVCGGEGIAVYSENLTHVGGVRYDHNWNFHWEACGGCGEWFGGEAEHQGTCDAEETCTVCGAEGIIVPDENLTHVGGIVYDHDYNFHWEACGGCGDRYGNDAEHQGTCDAEETCTVCGAEGVWVPDENITHVGEVGYDHDDHFHWEACDVCGEMCGEAAYHQAGCDAEETCTVCGAEGVFVPDENLTHVGETLFDSLNHWQECSACFETISEPERHTVLCSAPDTCTECGASGLVWDVSDMSHVGEISLTTDDTHHCYSCSSCGETYGNAPHTAACTTPTVCTVCEATGVTIAEENLTHGSIAYAHDDASHWEACGDCGEALSAPVPHEGYCWTPGVCDICKATGVTVAEENLAHGFNELVNDATSHWWACEDCGEPYNDPVPHQGYCTAPGVCITCNATGVTIAEDSLIHGDTVYDHDANTHWSMCEDCGKPYKATMPHEGYCADAGTCIGCGATGVTITEENLHHGNTVYAHDANGHWSACEGCGKPYSDPEPHEGYCADAGVCHICEATGVTITEENLYHGGAVYAHDANSHWWACGDCGEPYSDLEPHRGYCADTSTCIGCGATGVTVADDSLIHGDAVYDHDANTHWSMCEDCGDLYSLPQPHEGYCDAGVCFICEATGVTFFEGYLYHHGATVYAHDANSHWQACEGCGEPYSDPEPHWANCDAADTCQDCEATGVTIAEENLNHGDTIRDYDANNHWWACEDCGKQYGARSPHYMDCSNPGVCLECGAENVNCSEEDTIHNGSVYYECASENEHTEHCSICNAELSRDFHTQACANPGVCMQCGAEGVCFDDTVHTAKVPYSYDDEHGVICEACGDIVWSSVHYAYCDASDQTWCAGCGDHVETIEVRHNGATSDCDSEYHWVDCPYCGVVDMEPHYGGCYDPTTCSGCGEMDVIILDENVEHSAPTYKYDTLAHWTYCDDCGETGDREEHEIYCDAPGVCDLCEATEIDADAVTIIHSTDSEYKHIGDADYHAVCCADCGEEYYFEVHYASCENSAVCADCGAENVNFEYTSHGDSHMVRDSKYHIEVCLGCGESLLKEEHYYDCGSDVTTVCSYCEYESTDGEPFTAYHGEQENQCDETCHWIACVNCGEVAGAKMPHVAPCIDPTTCSECYLTNLSIPEENIIHYPLNEYFYDVDGHWHACGECGATTDEGEHEAVDGTDVCICGMTVYVLKITRQPASALVQDGAIASISVAASGDGLTYTWYYRNPGTRQFYQSTVSSGSTYRVRMNDSRNGRYVYCVITDQYGNSVQSDTVILAVRKTLEITQQPVSVQVQEGETASVSVGASGVGLTYTWYYKSAGGKKFIESSLSTGSTYKVKMTDTRAGRQVYCVIMDAEGQTVQSETVTLGMR